MLHGVSYGTGKLITAFREPRHLSLCQNGATARRLNKRLFETNHI